MAKRKEVTNVQDQAVPNPTLYRQMQEPHGSREAAIAAVTAFFDDVQEARKKHRMTDVGIVCLFSYAVEGEDVGLAQVLTIGDQLKSEYLFAQALGTSIERRERIISKQIGQRFAT